MELVFWNAVKSMRGSEGMPVGRSGESSPPSRSGFNEVILRMLEEDNPDKLTVIRIIDRVGCSRTTFYHYYESLDLAVEEAVVGMLRRAAQDALAQGDVEIAVRCLIEFAAAHWPLWMNLKLSSRYSQKLEEVFYRETRSFLRELIVVRSRGKNVNLKDLGDVISFDAHGISNIVLYPVKPSSEEIDYCARMVTYGIEGYYIRGENRDRNMP